MGGSLGLALKANGFQGRVSAYARRRETRELALELGAVDEVFDSPEQVAEGADLIVFCVPIRTIPSLVSACRSVLKPRCVITDVGSTKAELHDEIGALLQETSAGYAGSHPICGSEQEGLESARKDLYEGAVVVVTADQENRDWLTSSVSELWELVGGMVRVMAPETHDRILARTSHLPHLISALLAETVAREDEEAFAIAEFCGTGFFDTTRVAEGSPAVWVDVVQSNRRAIQLELAAYKDRLDALIEVVSTGKSEALRQFLADAREQRKRLVQDQAADENGEANDESK